MKIRVINLDRSTERLAAFRAANSHLSIQRFPAIDGTQLQPAELLPGGIATTALQYNAGALGRALSHLHLCELCAAGDEPLTVCEDDAVLRHDFARAAAPLLEREFDLIQWGWAFENAVEYAAAPSLRCLSMCDFATMRADV